MKPNHAKARIGGFTIMEGIVCVAVLAVLVGLLLPALAKTGRKSKRLTCTSNLKIIGLGFRMWSNDHGDKFPWDVSSKNGNGGTKELGAAGDAWRHFQVISNEVNTPKVFVCGNDEGRTRVANRDSFTTNSHLSFFVGLDADTTKPQSILSGDRNLAISTKLLMGVASLTPSTTPEWTTSIHNKNGNIGLADGSAVQLTSQGMNKQLQSAFLSTTQSVFRFAFPQ